MEEDRYTRITLRIPKDLHVRLQEQADATSKSTNAEIVARLEGSFTPADKDAKVTALESAFEATGLKLEVERLRKLLEEQKAETQEMLQVHSKTLAAEVLKHLYAEAGETIEAARQATADLKAVGKWPPPSS